MADIAYTQYELKDLEEQVMSERIHDPEKAIATSRKILEKASGTEMEERMSGIAYYCIADASLALNSQKDFEENIVKAITFCENAGNRVILVRCYNLMAISMITQGNYPMALDNYLKALDYAENKIGYEAGLIYSNIGELYGLLNDHESSIRYYKLGYQCFIASPDSEFRDSNLTICLVEIARGYFYLGNLDSAVAYLSLLRDMEADRDYVYNGIAILGVQAIIYNAAGQTEKSDLIIKKIMEQLEADEIAGDTFVDLIHLADFLEDTGKSYEFNTLIAYLEDAAVKAGSTNYRLQVASLRIRHTRKIGDTESERKYLEDFYELFLKYQEDALNINLKAVELRQSLAFAQQKRIDAEKQNEILKKRSTIDALTGLPNRYALNEYAEKAFDDAYRKQKSFAIEILDIDCFKEYNDTYGHQKGDECLKTVADRLNAMAGRDIFAARYGGDEFVIIYQGKTDEMILELAESLRLHIAQMKIENRNSHAEPFVTISQGIRNSVPEASDKVWDFLYTADSALYKVKKTEKNKVMIVHRPTQVLYD